MALHSPERSVRKNGLMAPQPFEKNQFEWPLKWVFEF